MKRILFFVSAVVLAAVAGCTSPKLTKLEAELDAVISKYDTAKFEDVPASELGWEVVGVDSTATEYFIKTDKTLLRDLETFCKGFFVNVNNFDDLVFERFNDVYSEYESDPEAYTAVDSQFKKYAVTCAMKIKNAPYERLRVKGGRVHKLINVLDEGDYSVFVELKDGQVAVSLPYLTLELSDAEFEKL